MDQPINRWFVRLGGLQKKAQEEVASVVMVPASGSSSVVPSFAAHLAE
jgi:hypothetical protein